MYDFSAKRPLSVYIITELARLFSFYFSSILRVSASRNYQSITKNCYKFT